MRSFRRFAICCVAGALATVAACSSDDTSESTSPQAPTATGDPVPISTEAPSTIATTSTSPATTEPTPEREERTYDFEAVAPIVQAFVDDRGLNGAGLIVVDEQDGVVYEDYWGEFSADRVSFIASSSKMITAGVLLYLHDADLLDIDAPVSDVVDWGAANPAIVPAQLISNSSGLVGLLPNPVFLPYLCQYNPEGSLQDCAEAIFATPDDDADVVPPDTEFRYGGAQWQVAGAVAEVASGKSWAELIEEIYIAPCDLEALGFANHFLQFESVGLGYPAAFNGDPASLTATANPNMEGGGYVTTGDYAKLLLMHLRGGMCDDTQVLSQEALDRMHADRIGEVYGGDAFVGEVNVGDPTSGDRGYGMGWWVDRSSGRISDGGAYGAVPWLDLEDGYGAYLVIEADSRTGNALADELYQVIDEAVTSS